MFLLLVRSGFVFLLMLSLAKLAASSGLNNEPARKYLWPSEAVGLAYQDVLALPEADRPHTRYVWVQNPTAESRAVLNFTIQTAVSQSSILVAPIFIAEGNLLRLDLRALAPQPEQFARLAAAWESQVDPSFYFVNKIVTETIVDVPAFVHTDGKKYTKRRQQKVTEVKTWAVHASHANDGAAEGLSIETKSATPIVAHAHFCSKALSVDNGGLYYRFMGFDAKPVGQKQSDQDFVLSLFGASEKGSEKLRSDERTAQWFSGVTAKPRRVDFFYGTGVRPSAGIPLITLTRDPQDGDIDPRQHPVKSLLNSQDRARELICQRPNGTLAYAIFDAAGKLQNTVPDNVAKDHTIPPPFTARLQCAISCISCHGPNEGWQPCPNDVQVMLRANVSGNRRFNIFDDESSKANPQDVLDRLAGLYSGNMEEPLQLAREAHERVCYKIGTAAKWQAEPARYARTLSAAVTKQVYSYWFDPITPQAACRELGYEVSEEKAAEAFSQLVPLLPANAAGVSTDDPTFATLRAWTKEHPLRVSRSDWELVFNDAMLRALAPKTKP
jgi:hypothetical protein